jgi:hypothetical protein
MGICEQILLLFDSIYFPFKVVAVAAVDLSVEFVIKDYLLLKSNLEKSCK